MNKPEPQPWDDAFKCVWLVIAQLEKEIDQLKATQQEQPK